ncbi:2-epi-5-epi-valiolone synthase [Thunnus albacares]|uniref:2-epi-5-epi-valiolone synthase n=1 Tax=Thunnus maccoyii TaxID=8240 RepID=UPI001C4D4D63|nr:2-epi-5-epi-valiolone synthase [Thunnus maccoyii]XP_042263437.1 2-epi-5-epi-valiolone synthase [Thunnus maccoyii]XP_044206030.1 2-epi-5-epi-valiolone synthase [Thunnus albacares]
MGKVHLENNDTKEKKTEYSLVRVKGTWTRKLGKRINKDTVDCVSAAKIYESIREKGTSWTVVTPIVFTYKVTETQGLLDPSNDTLLLGHLTDPQQLEDIKKTNKPLKRFVVVDQEVYKIYGPKLTEYLEAHNVLYKILALPTTEENKSMEMAMEILEEVNNFSLDRRTEPIIAIGGGVCLDIVGLAASLYRRRTPYIRVPTTLLSYIDASVGAKTGVNFANCKNKLGAYIPPTASFLDLSFIQTVPRRHISNGLAEMLKMALVKHRGLFELLEKHGHSLLDTKFQGDNTVYRHNCLEPASQATRMAITTMLEELAPNLWEDDLNRLVDFGHIISPALEMKVLPSLLHGEAVNIDMSYMVYVSQESGLLTEEEKQRIISCMVSLELPVWHQACTMELIQKSLQDRLKHSGGLVRMPLPVGLGQAEIFNNTSYEILHKAYEKWCNELSASSDSNCDP